MCMKMSGRAQRLQMMAQMNQEQEAAAQGRAQEDQRQGRLSEGTQAINRLFDPQQLADGSYSGFDDNFYNNYKKKYLDFYNPDIDKQYQNASEKTDFQLADAGTFDSNARAKNQAELVTQRDTAKGQIAAKANTAAGELKTQVGNQKTALLNQLYATENPDIASNQAINSVKTIQNTAPDLQPLGEIMKIAAIGGANAYNAYSNPYARLGTPGASTGKPAAYNVPT